MKMTGNRRGAFTAFVGVALLLVTATAVWACTAQPRIFSLGPHVGPVGLEITLEGQVASSTPVEVRWNSLEGEKIGAGMADFNGNFAVTAKIPQAEPGIYFLVVRAGDAGVVRSPFEVTSEGALSTPDAAPSADSAASSADLWSAFSDSGASVDGAGAPQGSSDSSGIQALAGAALLAAGIAGLASGLVVARRRSRATE